MVEYIKLLAVGEDFFEKFNKRCKDEEDVSMICVFLCVVFENMYIFLWRFFFLV